MRFFNLKYYFSNGPAFLTFNEQLWLQIADIESGAKQYRELFRQTLNIDYVELAFKEYENQLRQSARGLVR